MNEKVVTIDVRDDIRQGREPYSRIMQAASSLKDGEALLLIAPFEPVPLFSLMARKGFSHQARPIAAGDWEVLFSRKSVPLAGCAERSRPSCIAGEPTRNVKALPSGGESLLEKSASL
jgi:uncharacterized protein (DUF2249 family)